MADVAVCLHTTTGFLRAGAGLNYVGCPKNASKTRDRLKADARGGCGLRRRGASTTMKSETECPRWGTQRAGLAAALIAVATLSTPTRSDVIVEGTIAPWLWNGNNYYLGSLIDP